MLVLSCCGVVLHRGVVVLCVVVLSSVVVQCVVLCCVVSGCGCVVLCRGRVYACIVAVLGCYI